MGTEYYADVGFGFVIDRKDFDKAFLKSVPDKTEMQPRYDPKTGERVEDASVVVEHGYDYYLIDGKEYDEDVYTLLDALAKKVGADTGCVIGDQNCDPGSTAFAFCVHVKRVEDSGLEGGKFDVGRDCYLNDLFSKQDLFPEIQAALKKLGIKVGVPRVVQVWGIC
jgi:hypothetical protein